MDNYGFVDLGLPSGLLWADRNVGAETPEGCGHYFAWGEVEGYGQDTSDGHLLNWDTCPWGKSTPPMNTLDAEHDAATQNMGADWRMPDERDFEELLNNCTTIWTTRDGKYGRLFTSKVNGNTLFFPAGNRFGSSLSSAGSFGYVWSRSLNSSGNAYGLYFSSSNCYASSDSRYYGHSVRGVKMETINTIYNLKHNRGEIMEKAMTKQEYEDGLMELNMKRAKMVFPFDMEMSRITQLRLDIKLQICDLQKQYERYAVSYETYLQKKREVNADFAVKKSQLRQMYEQNHVVEEERVSPDKESLYKVRSCVLACLKKSLNGMCNTDGIQFNFHTEENGDVRFECHIPDIECDSESVEEDDKEY